MRRFPQKRILITGAGSGLGRAIALEFAHRDWRVAVAEVNRARADETAKMVKETGGQALVIPCDVTKMADLEKAAKTVKNKWGGLDILVNNAGVAAGGYMEKITLDKWKWIMDINLMGVVHGCKAFIPLFKKQKSGYIANVASAAGIGTMPEMSSYNVTKAGVIALSQTLRVELAPDNIGVSVVCPSFFKTNLMDQFSSPDKRQRDLAELFFEKSSMTAEKIAKIIYRSINRNRLYIIPQIDAKFLWWTRRHFPNLYCAISAYVYKKGLMEKMLGYKGD